MSTSSLQTNLYRQNAINHLNSVENIHSALTILGPSEKLWIMFSILVLAGMLLWGFYGSVRIYVDAQGIIIPEIRIADIEKLIKQTEKDRSEKIAELADLYNKKRQLYAKHYITIENLFKTQDDYFAAKQELSNPNATSYRSLIDDALDVSINSANTRLDALVFVNHSQGKKITVGMNAYILPNNFSQYDYGYIYGRVENVSLYPISKQQAYSYLGNMNLVDDFFQGGAPYIVKIQLISDPSNRRGLSWTNSKVANIVTQPGTMVSAKIVYKNCSPFRLIRKI